MALLVDRVLSGDLSHFDCDFKDWFLDLSACIYNSLDQIVGQQAAVQPDLSRPHQRGTGQL